MRDVSTTSSQAQSKAFKQRLKYRLDQGMSYDEAFRFAHAKDRVPKKSKLRLVRESRQKKSTSNTQPKSNHPIIEGRPQKFSTGPKTNFRPLFSSAFSLLVVVCATLILVKASAEALGGSGSLMAWTKALLLELGVLGLSAYEGPDKLQAKVGAFFLICVAFFVLHAGVKSDEARKTAAIEAESDAIQSLKDQQKLLLEIGRNLPDAHLTRKQKVADELSVISARLDEKRSEISSGLSVSAEKEIHLAEILLRLGFLFLNIFFARRLVEIWKDYCRERIAVKPLAA